LGLGRSRGESVLSGLGLLRPLGFGRAGNPDKPRKRTDATKAGLKQSAPALGCARWDPGAQAAHNPIPALGSAVGWGVRREAALSFVHARPERVAGCTTSFYILTLRDRRTRRITTARGATTTRRWSAIDARRDGETLARIHDHECRIRDKGPPDAHSSKSAGASRVSRRQHKRHLQKIKPSTQIGRITPQ
jgi:hypothetical protein